MRRHLLVPLAVLAALAVGTSAAPAAAPVKAVETCGPIFVGASTPSGQPGQHYFDPIVFPGDPGFPVSTAFRLPAHWHNFFGSDALDENTMADPSTLLEGATSCSNPLDRSTYWAPSLIVRAGEFENVRVNPVALEVTLGARGTLPPLGTALISHKAKWDCGPGTPSTAVPHVCHRGTIQAVVRFPRPDGIARLTLRFDFAVGSTYSTDGTGRGNLPVSGLSVGGVSPLPTDHVDYPILTHDPRSMHADVIFAFLGDPRV